MDRIVVVALVNSSGEIMLRIRDEISTTRPNRWSLPGGGAEPGETPVQAGVRLVKEQTGVALDEARMREVWHGLMPDLDAEAYLFATPSSATILDTRADPVLGAPRRFQGYTIELIPGDEVLNGRPFTPVTGEVLVPFLDSVAYRELVTRRDLDELA
jgi:8-oxo-dGTP pyrophosphatase MutT (NUDIX family)